MELMSESLMENRTVLQMAHCWDELTDVLDFEKV